MKEYLIILSGWGVSDFVWNPILNLLKIDYEVIIINWNHVNSLDEFKQKVVTILREKNINKFSMLGWSLGSLVAINLITSYSFKINHLILISGTSKFIKDQKEKYNTGWDKKILNKMISMFKKYPKETLNNFYKNLFNKFEVNNGYYDKFFNETLSLNIKDSTESLSLGLQYLMLKDFRDKISHIHIPVLLIHGEEDFICPVEASIFLKNNIKNSKLVILKKTGHIPFYINPDECYKIIKQSLYS